MKDQVLREQLVATVKRLDAQGLNRGSTGNLSVRASAVASAVAGAAASAAAGAAAGAAEGAAPGFWVTATGMPADEMGAADLVLMGLDGQVLAGAWAPSTEWPFHLAVYLARPDLHAVVHLHSPHATALACLRRPLPAFHYMVAVAGGTDVPCTPYHLFGTQALSEAVGAAFVDRNACLMANHGLVAGGTGLAHAAKVAVEIEALCGIYLQALSVGEPALLTEEQMAEVLLRFRSYGRTRRV